MCNCTLRLGQVLLGCFMGNLLCHVCLIGVYHSEATGQSESSQLLFLSWLPILSYKQSVKAQRERERENYAEKGGNPFLHMLREWTLT